MKIESFIDKFVSSYKKREFVVFCAECEVNYSGKAETNLAKGHRIIILKPVLVQPMERTKFVPTWNLLLTKISWSTMERCLLIMYFQCLQATQLLVHKSDRVLLLKRAHWLFFCFSLT